MSEDAFIDHILSLKKQVSEYGQEVERLGGEIAKRDAEIERLRAERRERIATACLAGMLANSSYEGSSGTFNGCAPRSSASAPASRCWSGYGRRRFRTFLSRAWRPGSRF